MSKRESAVPGGACVNFLLPGHCRAGVRFASASQMAMAEDTVPAVSSYLFPFDMPCVVQHSMV
jgi:hypothetical protein